jgi:hypothetical protein
MVREDGEWYQEFGDYEKSVVKDELQDKRDHDIKAKDLHILEVDGDMQADVDIAISRFTGQNIINRFPGIKTVALVLAYDNVMINHTQTETAWLRSLDPVLGADGVDEADLNILDQWCQTLTNGEVETLAAGEQTEMEALQQKCPKPELCNIFNDIFEN